MPSECSVTIPVCLITVFTWFDCLYFLQRLTYLFAFLPQRASLTDFERFKLYKTKQKVNRIVKAIYNRLEATQRKEKAKKKPKVEKKPRTARNKRIKAKRLAKKEAAKKA